MNVRLVSTRPGAWFFARVLYRLDRGVQRFSGGRASLTALLAGYEVGWLTTLGARTGQPRTSPLVITPDGEGGLILVASYFGQGKRPAWYHNLCAHPEVTLAWRGQRQAYQAQTLAGAEREAAWAKAVTNYPGYADYARRVDHQIPVVRLTPKPG
jgi:deazaflavin-dependent oxidoreductase (nitroreductase family)